MYNNVMFKHLHNERKQVFLIMLLTAVALICIFTTSFARADESKHIIVADLVGDLQRTLEKSAREVINNPAAPDSRRVEQPAANQPVAPSQNPEQAIPAKKAKKATKGADASLLTGPMQNDGITAAQNATSLTASQWQVLKIGQSRNGITYKGTVNNAIVFFGKTPVAKCRARYPEELAVSEVRVSPVSPTGQYIAVFCSAEASPASGVQLFNLKTKSVFSPNPRALFEVLDPWISFSPDDRYAVLNQSGDEGNYAPLVLDLNTRRAKKLNAPLFPHEEGTKTTWLSDRTAKYRRSDACDDKSCKSVGTYEFEVDVSTMKVKRTRVGN
jgi:hypothetical protein